MRRANPAPGSRIATISGEYAWHLVVAVGNRADISAAFRHGTTCYRRSTLGEYETGGDTTVRSGPAGTCWFRG